MGNQVNKEQAIAFAGSLFNKQRQSVNASSGEAPLRLVLTLRYVALVRGTIKKPGHFFFLQIRGHPSQASAGALSHETWWYNELYELFTDFSNK
jgi:hypothetical protein